MGKKLTIDEFVKRSNLIHHDKYNYSFVVYLNNRTPVKILCPSHGEFLQKPEYHLMDHGCPKCGNLEASNKNRKSLFQFIQDAIKIHKNKYDYSKVCYKSAIKKVEIICPFHGSFFQKPNAHLNGCGCIKCGIVKVADFRRKSQTQFIEEARSVHGNIYDYSKSIYRGEHLKLEIICKIHGNFWQSPHLHLHRDSCGCPKCRMSKGEQKIISYFDRNNISYITQKSFDNCRNPKTGYLLKYDFYLPHKNILIEYDGNQHFVHGRKLGNYISTRKDLKNIKYRDSIKTKYAKQSGISLLRIKYTQLDKVDQILESKISKN